MCRCGVGANMYLAHGLLTDLLPVTSPAYLDSQTGAKHSETGRHLWTRGGAGHVVHSCLLVHVYRRGLTGYSWVSAIRDGPHDQLVVAARYTCVPCPRRQRWSPVLAGCPVSWPLHMFTVASLILCCRTRRKNVHRIDVQCSPFSEDRSGCQ